jgi:RimJ/RimL family protein N-acetyltransferase
MIHGMRVVLRALSRDDLPRLHQFDNDIEVELAGGGDPLRQHVWSDGAYDDLVIMAVLRPDSGQTTTERDELQ